MAARRTYGSYNDGCASAHALDLIGERWALIVVRELLLGAKRFADLQRDIPGIGPAVLTQRLHDLERAGIARRRTLGPPARVTVYELTEWGQGLEAVNNALSQWAVGSPDLPWQADMSPDTLVLAMRAHARPLPSGTSVQRVALELRDARTESATPVRYLAELTTERSTIERVVDAGGGGEVDAIVWADTRDWKAHIIGGLALGEVTGVEIEGDRAAVEHLLAATRL